LLVAARHFLTFSRYEISLCTSLLFFKVSNLHLSLMNSLYQWYLPDLCYLYFPFKKCRIALAAGCMKGARRVQRL
jgi:hypothetical protein